MRQGLLSLINRCCRQQQCCSAAFSALGVRYISSRLPEDVGRHIEENKRAREEGLIKAMDALQRRDGSPLPHPSLRLDAYRGLEQHRMPHYPGAYLESKHCKIFAHWKSPKGVAEWTGFLAAQLYNAGAATIAHSPSWLPGVNMQRDKVWLRRLLLLESIVPVPGSTAAWAAYVKMLWSLRYDASYLQKHTRYMQTFQQESENGRAHLVALLSVWPSTAQNLLVLLGQAAFAPTYVLAYVLAPRVCHTFMSTLSGLTGEALSDALRDLDAGKVPIWDEESLPAPVLAYWGLPEGTSMRTLLLVMRADLNTRMIINQGADFRSLRLEGALASFKEYLNEENPLDYTMDIEDVTLPRNLYGAELKGPPEGLPSSQSRQYSTVPGLPPIKEKRFPGLRRLWGSASRSSSQRAPSVSSAASSEQESVVDQIWPTRVSQRGPSVSSMASSNHESALEQLFPAARKASSVSSMASTSQEAALQQLWPRATKASSPASSVASELDSAQALARSRSKSSRPRSDSLQGETLEKGKLQGVKDASLEKTGPDIMGVMDNLWGR